MRVRRANRHYRSRELVRAHLQDLMLHPRSQAAPRRLRAGVDVSAELIGGWRVFRLRPTTRQVRGTVVYLHGGGWIHEAAPAHWRLVQQIASEVGVEVLMPVYPLAHEGGTAATVVPQIVELCLQQSGPVVLAGDSAGGSIGLSAALALGAQGSPPVLSVLVSPAVDLLFENPQIAEVQPSDPWLVRDGQIELAEMWLDGRGDDPVLNPINGDLKLAGEMLIFSGTRDITNPDTRLLVSRGKDADARITFVERPGLIHVYPLLPIPEGRQARRMITAAIQDALAVKE